MRVHFDEVFEVANGSIRPRGAVRVGGVQMGTGVSFGGGVSMGGFNPAEAVGKYLEVEKGADGILEIKGVYQ